MKRLLFASIAVLSCSVGASAYAANLTPQAIRKSLASAGYGAELLRTDTEGHALIRTGTEQDQRRKAKTSSRTRVLLLDAEGAEHDRAQEARGLAFDTLAAAPG